MSEGEESDGLDGSSVDPADDGLDDDDYREPTPLWVRIAVIAAVVALIGVGVGVGLTLTKSSPRVVGPEGVPLQDVPDLAPASSTASGAPIDGMTCNKNMNIGYHVHVHLNIFVNGQQERIPAGAGIVPPLLSQQVPGGLFVDNSGAPGSCVYWLHVHANDGIIHVEAPSRRKFTLGQFFDVWRQPLGPDQVGPATGTVTAYVNGKIHTGDPRDIALDSQAVVQLDVGNPVVAFKPMHFTVTGNCSQTCSAGTTGG